MILRLKNVFCKWWLLTVQKKCLLIASFTRNLYLKKKKNVLHNEIDVKLFALSHKNVKQKKESLILQIFF